MTFPSQPDEAPYEASNAYGIEHVPTMVVVGGDGRVADVVESVGPRRLQPCLGTLAALLGADAIVVSEPSDGLPEFRPG